VLNRAGYMETVGQASGERGRASWDRSSFGEAKMW
jgi:hypothetical protein